MYLDDPITKLPGVQQARAKLLGDNGINEVQDLLDLTTSEIKKMAKRTRGLSEKGITNLVDFCAITIDEFAPKTKYFIDDDNPYRAKYGSEMDEWGKEA